MGIFIVSRSVRLGRHAECSEGEVINADKILGKIVTKPLKQFSVYSGKHKWIIIWENKRPASNNPMQKKKVVYLCTSNFIL